MEWINEGKPRSSVHEDSIFDDPELPPRENNEGQNTALRTAPIFEKSTTERTKTPEVDADIEIDDIYDATPRPNRTKATQQVSQTDSLFGGAGRSIFGNGNTTATDDFPDGDMEALLAEQEAMRGSPKSVQHPAAKSTAPEDDFEDDLDALMAEQEAEREALQVTSKPAQPPAAKAPHEDEFGDDLEALIAEEEMMQASLKPAQVSIAKTTPPTDEFDDDMEAMAEMDAMW
ncbi:hypothetical protein G7Y89_g8853 [Cudoniella acicularis]|uniref:Uncharacterized protein n=1 Tax=Cudoniella acicularis TaxID=354080 RepID=A0A8H4W2H7_9HELO|nr:hypothetical protein G7Y89_g8853 [Cudoniella acicularis]